MKNFFLLLFTILLFIGCKQSSENNIEGFFYGIIDIKGEIVKIDALIGTPSDLCCTDTRLLILDRYDNYSLTIFDTENNRTIGRELQIGSGPGEVIWPLFINLSNQGKQLNVFQRQSRIFNKYHFSGDKLSFIESAIIEKRPGSVVAIENGFVGYGMNIEMGRYGIYNKQGGFVQEAGVYQHEDISTDYLTRLVLHEGYLCSHPNGTHFAFGEAHSDLLEFFSCENGEIQLLKRHGKGFIKAKLVIDGGNNSLIFDSSNITGYKKAYSTEKYCYMLYSGKPYGEAEKTSQRYWSENIFVFDWNGNFVKSYRLDNEIRYFCVDESNNIIYGVVMHEGEMEIMKFKMFA